MPSTPEAVVEKIINHVPENPKREVEINLGKLDGGIELVYGIYPYQQRLVDFLGEPLTGCWTRQPCWALRSRSQGGQVSTHTLAYATNVRALGGGLATAIWDRLAATPQRRQVL